MHDATALVDGLPAIHAALGLGDAWRPIEERIRDQFDGTGIEAPLRH